MAIDRTQYNLLVDDSGAGTDGTVIDKNKFKVVILDPIDTLITDPTAFTPTIISSGGGTPTYSLQVGRYRRVNGWVGDYRADHAGDVRDARGRIDHDRRLARGGREYLRAGVGRGGAVLDADDSGDPSARADSAEHLGDCDADCHRGGHDAGRDAEIRSLGDVGFCVLGRVSIGVKGARPERCCVPAQSGRRTRLG
jgi:hypothetical protein